MIYLDHNATSPLRPNARAAMVRALDEAGNASSVHAAGRRARATIEDAREKVARLVGARSASVVFTSGGTEANALVLRGAGAARLFVLSISHDSVRANAVAENVVQISVTRDGVIDLARFRALISDGKGALVSVMAANNETGVIQPIEEIIAIAHREGALVHVDAVAAAGRMPIAFNEWDADYLTLSAHKLGGPQGAGALVVKDTAPLVPLMAGSQEMRRRGGTENVAAIAGFGAAAAEEAARDRNRNLARLRDRFEDELRALVPNAVIFGQGAPRLANTSNFAIPGLLAETALIGLDLDGVAVSSGAACSSGTVKPSHVLAAMGVATSLARCGVRLSLGWSSKNQDIDAALASLNRLLARKARVAA